MDDVERVASATLSHGVHGRVAGYGEAFGESLRSMLIAVALAILFTYIVLASQFESLVHPITVMISVPLAVVGALGALLIVRMPLSLFAFIGMFALVGVVAQNAILFVEFALQRLAAGQPIELALEEAGGLRLRAILMTALNSIAGALPLAIPHGPGGTIRAPLGVVVIGGLSASTVLTLVVVPVVFLFMEGFARRMRRMVGAPALRGAAAETETAAAAAEPPPERSAGE